MTDLDAILIYLQQIVLFARNIIFLMLIRLLRLKKLNNLNLILMWKHTVHLMSFWKILKMNDNKQEAFDGDKLILRYFVLKMLLRNLIKTLAIRMMLWLRKVIFLCLILFRHMMFCILKEKSILQTILFLSCEKKVWKHDCLSWFFYACWISGHIAFA